MWDEPAVPGTQSIARAVRILKLLAQCAPRGLRLVDLAEELQLERPTAHRLLKVLISEGLLVRDTRSRLYTLGPLVFELGLASTHQFNLRAICAPVLERLAAETGDTSFLFVRSGSDAVCLSRVQGAYPIQTPVVPIGSRQPLGVSAGGLALLSCLPEDDKTRVLKEIGAQLHNYGSLDVQELRRLCAEARSVGYAHIAGRAVPGVSALGLPIRNPRGNAVAAITVATTQARMTDKRVADLLPMLRRASEQIAQLIGV
ncbi:IclR family transcriptional regulator [Methylobacterium sp. P31]